MRPDESLFRARIVALAAGAALVLAATLLLVLAGAAQAAFPGKNGRIAFSRAMPSLSTEEALTIRANGKGERSIFETGAIRSGFIQTDPHHSPDGKTIALTGEVAGTAQILSMSSRGGAPAQLTSGTQESYDPAWSPDGKRIVFVRDGSLFTMAADGSDIRQLTTSGPIDPPDDLPGDFDPTWSPDGKRIAFARVDFVAANGIYTIRPDGTGEKRLTKTGGIDEAPDYSPSGKRIVFSSIRRASRPELFTMKPNGKKITVVKKSGRKHQTDPAYSPDGKWIAYMRSRELFKIRANGKKNTKLLGVVKAPDGKKTNPSHPSWQPK